jgi:restriction system protein
MAVPSYHLLINPLLRYLAKNPDGVKASVAYDAVADAIELTDEERAKLLPSGIQEVYKNRIGWAHDRLKRSKLSESPRRGWWKITPAGIEFARQHPDSISPEEINKIRYTVRDVRLKEPSDDDVATTDPDTDVEDDAASP